MSNRYKGLTTRDKQAVKGQSGRDIQPYVEAIKAAGGKVTKKLPAPNGVTRITFCPQTGSGHRLTIMAGPGYPVRAGEIRRQLGRVATAECV